MNIRIKKYDFNFYCLDENDFINFEKWFNRECLKVDKVEIDEIFELLKTAFQSRFIESDKYIFEKLKKHIVNCKNEWINKTIYAPIVVICQSSGYGKTKTLFEYAKTNFTVFICLRQQGASGYPPRSSIANKFIDSLIRSHYETSKTSLQPIEKFLLALIEASLEFYGHIIQHDPDLNKEKISEEFRKYQPWLDTGNIEFIKNVETKISFSKRVEQLTESLNEKDDNLKREILKKFNYITIVIDEAHSLINDNIKNKSLYHHLISTIRSLFEGYNIVFAATSTNTSMLIQNQITNSETRTFPFCELVYCDQLKSIEYENEFKLAVENKNLFEFINQRDPLTTIFYGGRPLWASINEAKRVVSCDQDIVNLATVKLIRARDWNDPALNKKYASLAILASRTTIMSNIGIINQEFTSNLITSYMATLFNADKDCNVLSVKYVSEPILAQAASSLMSDETTLNDILDSLYAMISSTDIVSTGNIGELVAEILILVAHDSAVPIIDIPNQFSRPITVSQFIAGLIGTEQLFFNGKENMMIGIVCFSHFYQKIDILKYDHLVNHFIMRCAAGRFKQKFPTFDYFIPVILKDNQIGMILIHVKNGKDLESIEQLEQIAEEMNFKVFDKGAKSELFTDLSITEDNSFKILISLGNDLPNISFKHNTLIISSVEKLNLKHNLKTRFKRLLNFSRNGMEQYEDKHVCQLVTHGCVDDNYFEISA